MVPKIIHIITGPKATPLIKKCIQSWDILLENGFEIKIWEDDSILEFTSEFFPFALPALQNARNHAEAADLARYLIVYHFGGYYIDWDIQLLDKDRFLTLCDKNSDGFLIQDPVNQTIASECFSASSGEKYLFSLVDNIVYIYQNGFRDSITTPFYSGPFRMREVYYFIKKSSKQNIEMVKDVFLYDYLEIRDMPKRDINVPMIHYWVHSWL